MKRIVALALAVSLLTFSNAFADVASDNTSAAAQEWRGYVEPLLPIGERMLALMPDQQDPQLRQELYRMLFSGISTAYMGLFLGDPEHPDFWPVFNQAYNWFAPNPDDAYYMAPVDGNGVYKISGFRGTARIVDFQISGGTFFTRGAGKAGPTFVNYDANTLHTRKDGAFEVILSTERPAGYKGNWWKLDPKATFVIVRQVHYDWLHEVDGRFAIERLDRTAIKPRPTAQETAENLRQISILAEGWTRFSMDWINKRYLAKGLVNKVEVNDFGAQGGFSAQKQKYIEGLFDIGPDEALIYETAIPKPCRYWNIELTDMLWSAIDYTNRQSNLNGYSARLDKDGKFRAVVSATDPGVPNWLDTAGYAKGAFLGRWTDCSDTPTPTIIKVKLTDVRNHLPADTPVVTAEERDAAIRLRRTGAQLRRRW